MADGYRFSQPSAGNYFYPSQTQQLSHAHPFARNDSPANNLHSLLSIEPPSPSRSPDSQAHAQTLYGMFGQTHQQGQHGRVSAGPGSRALPMMYNYQHQNAHQQQQHTQHHQGMQQDHNVHAANGTSLGHHTGYSSGVLSNSTPSFTPNSLQNGHATTTRGGQAQPINEHWAEQLKAYKDSEGAHSSMIEHHAPHHYARLKATENHAILKGDAASSGDNTALDSEVEDTGRPTNSELSLKRQDWYNLDLSGQGLRVLAAPLFNYEFLRELYIPSNKLTHLPAVIGKLRHLTFLDASHNSLSELPPELGMCVYLKQLYLFDNNLHTLPNELGYLYHLEMLGIEGNPIDAGLKQAIMEKGTKALVHHLREQAPVPLPPQPRVILDMQDGVPAPPNQERFRVVSYNILCERYATTTLYGYTPSTALSWDYRREQVLQEIEVLECDFICLQEISTEAFKEYFSVKLAYHNYRGLHWPKGRAKTMTEKDARGVDGCAIFYNSKKYILLDKQLVDFANIAINRPDMKNQHDIFNRVMPRDHIAVIAFFENRYTGSRMIVVNAHLFHDKAYADVKAIQTAILMESISKYAEKYVRWPACKDKKAYKLADDTAGDGAEEEELELAPSQEYTNSTQIPLLLCGDFNSTPDSGVYNLLANGRMSPDHEDLRTHQYGNFTRDGIQHPFSLRSAYAHLQGTPDEMQFTNYTPGFTGTLEYIWYSTNALDLTAILGPLDNDYLKRAPGFPNYHFPSDHLALMAEFAVKGRKDKKTREG